MSDITGLKSALTDRYAIDREIGAGGMATVYLARDIRHDRKVALKVLKPELGAVLGVERFLSEIKTTAKLQHPHILPLLDSGDASGLLFYVMPYVEGETLRARLERERQLPIQEAVRIAREVASALDYAHRHGVIHRDIKPENILLHDGQALVADFGIALAVQSAGGQRMTQTGLSLGTPQYMSPEQAMGERGVDARSDIYALGAVTYEMLAGDAPFTGSSVQAIVARVLNERPTPLHTLRDTVPAGVEHAVLTALAKLAADRFATAREFAEALEEKGAATSPVTGGTRGAAAASPAGGVRARLRDPVTLALGALALVGVVLGARELTRGTVDSQIVTSRFFLTLPGNMRVIQSGAGSSLAISPDGRMLVVASVTQSTSQLFIRPIDQLVATPLPGTEVGRNPAFSPDGRWIAFTYGTLIKKVSVEGGPATILGTIPGAGAILGLSWASASRIIVGTGGGLHEMPAEGGAARRVSELMKEHNEGGQRWPLVLPGGRSIVYMSTDAGGTSTGSFLGIASIETGRTKRLGVRGTYPLGLVDGLLLYSSVEGRLMAVPYDAGRDTVTGSPFPVVEAVVSDNLGTARAALSESGTLVYLTGASTTQPVLVDWRGAAVPILPDARGYGNPRFSRDGREVAYVVTSAQGTDIWVQNRTNGTFTRLTSEGTNSRPEWSPDGKRIVFWSSRGAGGSSEVWWAPVDGSAAAELLYKPEQVLNEALLSPDGEWLVYRTGPGARQPQSIFAVRLKGDRKEIPIVTGTSRYLNPRLSHDGRWLAYHSDESGAFDIYVRPFPGPGARVQVSSDGGTGPMWGPEGRTLYYLHNNDLVQVSVTTGPSFSIGARRTVFSGEYISDPTHANYDIARDGEHALMLRRAGDNSQAIIVLNWPRELAAKRAAQAAR